jgi:hypothetical protein
VVFLVEHESMMVTKPRDGSVDRDRDHAVAELIWRMPSATKVGSTTSGPCR